MVITTTQHRTVQHQSPTVHSNLGIKAGLKAEFASHLSAAKSKVVLGANKVISGVANQVSPTAQQTTTQQAKNYHKIGGFGAVATAVLSYGLAQKRLNPVGKFFTLSTVPFRGTSGALQGALIADYAITGGLSWLTGKDIRPLSLAIPDIVFKKMEKLPMLSTPTKLTRFAYNTTVSTFMLGRGKLSGQTNPGIPGLNEVIKVRSEHFSYGGRLVKNMAVAMGVWGWGLAHAGHRMSQATAVAPLLGGIVSNVVINGNHNRGKALSVPQQQNDLNLD